MKSISASERTKEECLDPNLLYIVQQYVLLWYYIRGKLSSTFRQGYDKFLSSIGCTIRCGLGRDQRRVGTMCWPSLMHHDDDWDLGHG